MVFVRKSVWASGGDFTDPILFWYAKGIGVLKQRAVVDPTSWRFLAAMHGISTNIWQQYGYLTNRDQLPTQSVQNTYWNQCQHQTWYFLPWHRGYLASLEAIVRDAIVKLGGPADWALPYWNYSSTANPNALQLPPAFAQPQMPDGSPNPLFVKQRYGKGTVPIKLPAIDVTLGALQIPNFTGTGTGGSPGFGGVRTAFSHFNQVNGGLERKPHNIIHVDIGGSSTTGAGLMSDPDTAALDPIFWVHHANIDRLWEVWLRRNPSDQNPIESAWLDGPLFNRKFIAPLPSGQGHQFTAKDMLQTSAPNLNYQYDDVSDPPQDPPRTAVIRRLGSPSDLDATPRSAMENQQSVELIGANRTRIALTGRTASTQVQLDNAMMQKVGRSFSDLAAPDAAARGAAAPEPDRIFLNIENIRSTKDGAVIDVYINLPSGANSAEHPDLCAGTIALFGVRKASLPDQSHGGLGVTEILDITPIIDALHLSGNLAVSDLQIQFIARHELTSDDNVTVERVSLYRQGH